MREHPNPKVMITVRDISVAMDLVNVFLELGIDAYWTTDDEGRKLAEAWEIVAWIRDYE